MAADPGGSGPVPGLPPRGLPGVVPVPEIRDYHQINAEVVQRLDAGHRHVRLAGAEGQRLLLAGLKGRWDAVVEVEGRAGPELAAGLDAPGLIVVCRGAAADGAARGLIDGHIVLLGDAGPAVAYAQRGGSVIVAGQAGPRAGLNQAGGDLILLGAVGPLAGERQSGGRLFAGHGRLGPHAGRGHRGGRLVILAATSDPYATPGLPPDDARAVHDHLERARPWLAPR